MGVAAFLLLAAGGVAARGPVAAPPAPPPVRCMPTSPPDGRWKASVPVEVCDPAGGCHALATEIVTVAGCLAVSSPPPNWSVLGETVLTNGFRRRIRHRKACSPEVVQSWIFVGNAGRQSAAHTLDVRHSVVTKRTCGRPPSSPGTFRLAFSAKANRSQDPRLGVALQDQSPREPIGAAAETEAAIRDQTTPSVCARIAAQLGKADQESARRVLEKANAPCLIAPIADRFLSDGWPEADAALARLVEDPAERFRLLLAATESLRFAPSLATSIPKPLSTSQLNRLVAVGRLQTRGFGRSSSRPSTRASDVKRCHPDAARVSLAFRHSELISGEERTAGVWANVLGELPPLAAACVVDEGSVQNILAERPERDVLATLALALADASEMEANVVRRAYRRAFLFRLQSVRRLGPKAWAVLLQDIGGNDDDDTIVQGLQRAFACTTPADPIQVPHDVGEKLIDEGIDLTCAKRETVDDFVARDPTDFDAFDDAALRAPRPDAKPKRKSSGESANVDATDNPSSRLNGKDAPSNDGDVDDAMTDDEVPLGKTIRARFFSEGLSVAPVLGATAFLEGPMVGGGLLGHWHLSDRFALSAMANAAFSCTLCIDGTTGTRTDLRLDVGFSTVALPHLDISPYARAAVAVAHIEVIEIRRAAFHDAIGPEFTVGIDWLPVDGARVFVETGGFWLFEFARSVRPGGQVPPSPRGVSPVDGSTYGVTARVGLSLKL